MAETFKFGGLAISFLLNECLLVVFNSQKRSDEQHIMEIAELDSEIKCSREIIVIERERNGEVQDIWKQKYRKNPI